MHNDASVASPYVMKIVDLMRKLIHELVGKVESGRYLTSVIQYIRYFCTDLHFFATQSWKFENSQRNFLLYIKYFAGYDLRNWKED